MTDPVIIIGAVSSLVVLLIAGIKLIKYIKCCNCFELVIKKPKGNESSHEVNNPTNNA